MKMIFILFIKYKSQMAYIFFGMCTTLINVLSYNVCYKILGSSNIKATVMAWFLAIIFAFITNKLWVFDSKLFSPKVLIYELIAFCVCRLITGFFDVFIMWVAVDKMDWKPTLWKIISNFIVIVLNYVASKLIIFNLKFR